jgi:hypothetical protein
LVILTISSYLEGMPKMLTGELYLTTAWPPFSASIRAIKNSTGKKNNFMRPLTPSLHFQSGIFAGVNTPILQAFKEIARPIATSLAQQ